MKERDKKYWWYPLVIIVSAIIGGITGAFLLKSIRTNETGTIADWLSVIGSLAAIWFAYGQIAEQKNQIAEQRREYEEDKKTQIEKEKLKNRPYFTLFNIFRVKEGIDNCYWKPLKVPGKSTSELIKDDSVYKSGNFIFKDSRYAYEITNVTKNSAVRVYLKVCYKNDKPDCLYATCLKGNSKSYFFPTRMFFKKQLVERVELYFDTTDGSRYCQVWCEKYRNSEGLEEVDTSKSYLSKNIKGLSAVINDTIQGGLYNK